NKIVVVEDEVKAKELEVVFVESIDSLLTKRTIEGLKRALDNKRVFLYPWDVKKKKGVIVEVRVDDFLYEDGEAILKGSFIIEDVDKKREKRGDFIYKRAVLLDESSLVKAFDELYKRVIIQIAKTI
ncbi:MAG: hypothetical protein GXN91_04375, partial [Epsilonproteobacteria bacterium]|nr:hypothetical protein [Campylobacterota bacterium]